MMYMYIIMYIYKDTMDLLNSANKINKCQGKELRG